MIQTLWELTLPSWVPLITIRHGTTVLLPDGVIDSTKSAPSMPSSATSGSSLLRVLGSNLLSLNPVDYASVIMVSSRQPLFIMILVNLIFTSQSDNNLMNIL